MLLKIHCLMASVALVIVLLDWLEDTIASRIGSCSVDGQVGALKRRNKSAEDLTQVRTRPSVSPRGRGRVYPFTRARPSSKDVAHHSQDLGSVGPRNGSHPDPFA